MSVITVVRECPALPEKRLSQSSCSNLCTVDLAYNDYCSCCEPRYSHRSVLNLMLYSPKVLLGNLAKGPVDQALNLPKSMVCVERKTVWPYGARASAKLTH